MLMNPTKAARTELDWKRTYFRELERKRRRQRAALPNTEVELVAVQAEIAELEENHGLE